MAVMGDHITCQISFAYGQMQFYTIILLVIFVHGYLQLCKYYYTMCKQGLMLHSLSYGIIIMLCSQLPIVCIHFLERTSIE